MPKNTRKPTPKASDEELDAFAHHLAEVLRVARTSQFITSRFYNSLAEAWNDFTNDVYNLDNFCDSEAYIRLVLKEQSEKGGKDNA